MNLYSSHKLKLRITTPIRVWGKAGEHEFYYFTESYFGRSWKIEQICSGMHWMLSDPVFKSVHGHSQDYFCDTVLETPRKRGKNMHRLCQLINLYPIVLPRKYKVFSIDVRILKIFLTDFLWSVGRQFLGIN